MSGSDITSGNTASGPDARASRAVKRPRPSLPTAVRFCRERSNGTHDAHLFDGARAWAEGKTLSNLGEGRYLEMEHGPAMVKSTISVKFNCDGRRFASTHGDHTVKIWDWPSGRLERVLQGHPRTPWAVKWHPTLPNVLASGCLGHHVIVWDAQRGKWLKKCTFDRSVSCVAFHPNGWFLAITAAWTLYLWNFVHDDDPVVMTSEDDAFHFVDFHPSGQYIITGQKNPDTDTRNRSRRTVSNRKPPFTLRLTLHRFTLDTGVQMRDVAELTVPRCVAYNDAGTHFSSCGRLLLVCIPQSVVHRNTQAFQIATIALEGHALPTGSIVHSLALDAGHAAALTNLKFSETSEHILAGFSFPVSHPLLRTQALAYHRANSQGAEKTPSMTVEVIHIYRLGTGYDRSLKHVKSIASEIELDGAARDEINVAVFSRGRGVSDGLVLGTQKGRIRMFHA